MFGVAVLGSATSGLNAQDRVWLEPLRPAKSDSTWFARSIKQIDGKITQLDNKQLRFVVAGDEAETLAASHRVIWIESAGASKTEVAAMKLFADGQYAESLRPLLDSLKEKPPIWRQQWLSMMASVAASRGSNGKISLELVAQLDSRPLAPLILAWLPIHWDSSADSRAIAAAASERLTDKSAAVRLVAASWLLSSPQRDKAIAALDRLVLENQRPVVARLAEIVRWRSATPPQIKQQADQWQARVAELPIVLQNGPNQTLIDRFQTAGLKPRAEKLRLSRELNSVAPILK